MLEKSEFIQFILDGQPARPTATKSKGKATATPTDALGGFGFDDETSTTVTPVATEISFARQLLEASGFGPAQFLATGEVILGANTIADHLPEKVYYWPKTAKRPYQTLLFELTQSTEVLLKTPLFRPAQGVLEDALSRLVQDTLKGFETGGAGKRDASVKQGRQEETLCVVSIRDERNRETASAHLVCFGTVARVEGSLETFHIREEARFWEPQLAADHLERLYDRHFKKLASDKWQDAFISGEERKFARKLMEVCQGKKADEGKIQEAVVDLLEEIALSYGLRKHPKSKRRLEATDLPQDHDIGVADEVLAGKKANPFKGMTLRDEKNRLLGYIVYCLDRKKDAEVLRAHLKSNNRFHNVLVVYPDNESTAMELWQGRRALNGKLTKSGAKFTGEGEVVNLLSRFFVVSKALVANPSDLAAELAYRARYLRAFALRELEKTKGTRDKDLDALYESFHEIFLKNDEADESKQHDQFADSYAQTLTYGLLSARWISKETLRASRDRFTLDNASDLLERTSPFFKELFTQVISKSHDASRDWLLQDITDLLDRIDIDAVFASVEDDVLLGHDPVMHFYEPFLAAYDAQIKRQRGVFYTPHPVVSYIVRSVHELLQTEFGLEDGLADTTTWGEMVKRHPDLKLPPLTDEEGEERTIAPSEPFVQILDPATGTATFLVEVIDVIHRTLMAKWEKQGLSEAKIAAGWNEYVPKHLLPRLFGYELMMAPYAIAHLKIGIKLAETGYSFGSKERARVYLTNALEPAHDLSGRLAFAVPALAHEVEAVNEVKRHKRFTVVVGNPPYSKSSQNQNSWIDGIMEEYKRTVRTAETQIQALSDDYAKFLRLVHFTLESSRLGILGYITNNGWLDGPLFRDMRSSMMNYFKNIRLLNLHGDSRKQLSPPEGKADENVFEIQQGVAVTVLSRSQLPQSESTVGYAEIWGTREERYAALAHATSSKSSFASLQPTSTHYLFIPVTKDLEAEFNTGWHLYDVFGSGNQDADNHKAYGAGFVTQQDKFAVGYSQEEIAANVAEFLNPKAKDEVLWRRFDFCSTNQWDFDRAKRELKGLDILSQAKRCLYRPFDFRYTVFDRNICTIQRTRITTLFEHENVGLLTTRRVTRLPYNNVFVSNTFAEYKVASHDRNTIVFPLWIYSPESERSGGLFDEPRRLNLNPAFLSAFALKLKVPQNMAHGIPAGLTPEDIFHYIYAVFHSPTYRTRYGEFLKIDFPRLPLSSSLDLFRSLANLGGELTALHLLESPKLKKPLTKFTGPSHEVTKPDWTPDHGGTVWIDAKGSGAAIRPGTSGFQGVPEAVWNFQIGGYQVCHKWLKDRKGRTLTDEDIAHYHQIVVALSETIRLMAEIDEVINEHGGWPGAFQGSAAATSPTEA